MITLRPIDGERRNAAVRSATAADAIEKPQAQNDLRLLVDVMQAVIDAQDAAITSLQAIIDATPQALADMDVIIDGYDAATAAQQRGMIKDLARAHKARAQDNRTLAREIKAKAQEAKGMARAIKRTIRLVA